MIVIKNKFIPFKGYETINLFGLLFTRGDVDYTEYNHEAIHSEQMLECGILGAVVIILLCIIFNLSFWLLLISPCTFYILYSIEYLVVRGFHKKQNDGYHDISFEEEAYNHEHDFSYIARRIPFNWVKYIKIKSN